MNADHGFSELTSILFDNDPGICFLFDDQFHPIFCNPSGLAFFGFQTVDEIGSGLIPRLEASIPPLQPSGRDSVPFQERLKTAVATGAHEFMTELEVHGTSSIVNVSMKRIPYRDSYAVAIYLTRRRDHDDRQLLMLDSLPLACAFLDDTRYQIIDCNMEAVRLYGFHSKEEFIRRQADIFPKFQHDGQSSRVMFCRHADDAMKNGRSVFDFMCRNASGEDLPVEFSIVRLYWHEKYVYVAYARDSFELERTRTELHQHSLLLKTVNMIAENLMEAEPDHFDQTINESLCAIGQAVKVDRCYMWENFVQEGRLYCRQVYEWSEGAEPQQGKDFANSTDYDDIPFWKEAVLGNRIVNSPVRNLPADARAILEIQGIRSILLIPIFMNGRPWGHIGFDDCHVERTFSKLFEQVLHSAGILMISALTRNDTTQRLITARREQLSQERLRRTVNEVASLLLETDQDDFLRSVYQSLMTLGLCADSVRAAVWRNTCDEEGRLGAERLVLWSMSRPFAAEETPLFIDYEQHIPLWTEARFDINRPVRDMNARLRALLEVEERDAYLLLPLNAQGDFWGFLELVTSREDYLYTEAEKSILRSAGMMIASAFVRHDINESLIEARESAVASMRAKSEFLSRMSHEIRTPMNAIIGMTALAQKSSDIKRIAHYLDTVNASSQQLLAIINDVLDMSKIDANKLEIFNSAFDFEEMLKHVFKVVQIKIDEKHIEFRLDLPQAFTRTVVSDELRLSQVLINLLSNAVKFTPDEGVVTLKVLETPIDAARSTLRIEVVDTGIGIAEEMLSQIFLSFRQGDGGITRQYGGTGLGLAICKRIVNLMGGEIWAESELGHGSRFIAEFDVEWGPPLTRPAGSFALRRNLRVLVVDDAADVLEYFQHVLQNFSLHCDTAASGQEAVELVEKRMSAHRPYDVIFLDWHMPGMSGIETAHTIKRLMHDDVIVIMISVADWGDIEQEALSVGVTNFLPKPVLSSDLYNALLQFVENRNPITEEPAKVYDWSNKRLLLAEDIDINRELVEAILEDTGIGIDSAENGQEALELYQAAPEKYNLILMDVQMPIMDGLTATRAIRASGLPTALDIPIIAMTANAFKEDEEASFNAGMNGHISKPIDTTELILAIKDAIH